MELILLATLCGASFALSTLLWHLYIHPDVVVSMFDRQGVTDTDWGEGRASAIRALRWALGVAVLAVGFITGAAVAILAGTPR